MNFQTPAEDGYTAAHSRRDIASYLSKNSPNSLRPLTSGMFGYSVTRQATNKGYFYDVYHKSTEFDCQLEAWHTESGPGVFEAVSEARTLYSLQDRVVQTVTNTTFQRQSR